MREAERWMVNGEDRGHGAEQVRVHRLDLVRQWEKEGGRLQERSGDGPEIPQNPRASLQESVLERERVGI